jgi:hypothetical protein
MTVAVAGIALGGSYWPHYLIALVPATAAGAAAFVVRHRRIGAVLVLAIALPFTLLWSGVPLTATPASYEQDAVSAGHYLRARAEPHQTAYVLYAKANVLYYSGLRDPFPYNWSLMMRSAPGAQARLRQLLASPRRPTWVIQWQSHHAFGLDRSGATGRLLTRRYRRVATVCGRPVWLARGARARPAPPSAGGCTAGDAAPGPTTVAVPAQHD